MRSNSISPPAADPFAMEVMLWVFIRLATDQRVEDRLQSGDDPAELYSDLAIRARIAAECFEQSAAFGAEPR